MATLLTEDDIASIQDAVAPATDDENVSLLEVWRMPGADDDNPIAGGIGKDEYGQPIGDTADMAQPDQERQMVRENLPGRITRAGTGSESGNESQPVTVAPWTITLNWADDPDIRGGDEIREPSSGRKFGVVDPGGRTTYSIVRLVRCEEIEP